MPSNKLTVMSLFLFFLEMVLASVVANKTATTTYLPDFTRGNFTETNENSTAKITSLTVTPVILNTTDNNSTSTHAPQNTSRSLEDSFTLVSSSNGSKAATVVPTTSLVRSPGKPTPSPMNPSKTTKSTTTTTVGTTKPNTASSSADHIVIIVLGLIILVVFAIGLICFFSRRRVRRYSVDLPHRADDANIPLSAVVPELPAESVPLNGLQTFEAIETSAKEPEEPEVKPETKEEQKTEAGEPAVEPSSESAAPAPAPAPDSSEDKPKQDAEEGNSPEPVKPSSEEKTDDEGAVSNKTSVESLKETNENNSNNTDSGQKTDVQTGNTLQEVYVDCLV